MIINAIGKSYHISDFKNKSSFSGVRFRQADIHEQQSGEDIGIVRLADHLPEINIAGKNLDLVQRGLELLLASGITTGSVWGDVTDSSNGRKTLEIRRDGNTSSEGISISMQDQTITVFEPNPPGKPKNILEVPLDKLSKLSNWAQVLSNLSQVRLTSTNLET